MIPKYLSVKKDLRRLTIHCLTEILVLVFVPLVCVAQVQLPETAAAHQCAAWLEAFNRGDREAYQEFLQKNFPSRAERLDREMQFREQTGGFELRKVEDSTPTKVIALVQERSSDQFARLTLETEAVEPHRITRLDLRAIPRPAEFSLPHMSESELITALRKQLEQATAAGSFAGAVLVSRNGKQELAEAYGLADREHKTPNTLRTRFRIGSMNKMFTAVATLQLVQAGKLELNDAVGKYLDRLSQQGRRHKGHNPSTPNAYRRHRRHLWAGV